MPPIRSQRSRDLIEQEGRILLAIQAFKNGEISSIREVARRFNIPRSTLQDRLRGHQQRAISRANLSKLTEIEEQSLKKWVLSMDLRGAAPPALYGTRNGGSSSSKAWNYSGSFGRPKLGYKLC